MPTRKQRLSSDVDGVYEQLDGDDIVHLWRLGQGLMSAAILTAATPEKALAYVIPMREKLYGKVVVEIGAGVGWMAIMMARYCKELYAIEADPAWSWVFTEHLYRVKPPNLTWIFGSAENMVGKIKADVAVVWTLSDTAGMTALGKLFAPEVILGPPAELRW